MAGISYVGAGGASLDDKEELSPNSQVFFHDDAKVIAGNDLVPFVSGIALYNNFFWQAASAINDEFHHVGIVMGTGTYTFYHVGWESTSNGIVTWYLDDTVIATGDWYDATPVANVKKTQTGIAVIQGKYTLKGKVLSKNASSGGHNMQLIKYGFNKE